MSLLHATWLFPPEGEGGRLLLWADTWRVAEPITPGSEVSTHPFTLEVDDLAEWLDDNDLWSEALRPASATLTLPSRGQAAKGTKGSEGPWSGLPLQAGQPIPKTVEWWPWRVEGMALKPAAAAEWLSRLPLSGGTSELADDLRWWSHLQRWALSLIARGRTLPLVEQGRARWLPLLNREDDRHRLEEFATRLPQVATCATAEGTGSELAQACRRPGSGRLRVAGFLETLIDGQLRDGFQPDAQGLDPLLAAWQQALGPGNGQLGLDEEETERLEVATQHWREAVAGRVAPARTALELDTPAEGEELWSLRFALQAEADPSLKLPAAEVWALGDRDIYLGEIAVPQPSQLLLEGLGRALTVFEPIERGLDSATPERMQLTPAEAFVLVRTAANQLRDVGVGVLLPPSLSGGLASRLGLAIKAFLQHLKAESELKRPVLLVAPTSVLTNWKREAHSFTPELNVREHYGPRRPSTEAALKKALKDVNLVLTSYGLLQRDSELLETIDWQGVVIDEAQAIKNPSAKQSMAARDLGRPGRSSREGRFRIALTGTPVENRVSELWALMDFLNPKVLGDEPFFRQRYRLPIERYGDMASLRDLKARVGPFILRRLKTDKSIISDLPEKLELSEWVGLAPEQKKLYNKTVEESLDAIARAPLGQKHGQVLALLTRLKQICNHPALALKETPEAAIGSNGSFASRSAKVQRLEEILEEVIEAGDRALLFTQFAEWGHLLKAHLERKWRAEVPFLHGGTSKNERQAMVDRFQDDPRGPQLFLLSLKAGGVGLNLTRASHVFHIDRWWNPAVENQATDRAYRIGQTNRVLVHKFITSGSVEERIDRMIQEKSKLAADIVGSGEDWLGGLDVGQLKDLVTLSSEEDA